MHALPPEQDRKEAGANGARFAADPALAPFLALLETDLATRPAQAVWPLPKRLTGRLKALAAEVGEVDPNAPIEGEASL